MQDKLEFDLPTLERLLKTVNDPPSDFLDSLALEITIGPESCAALLANKDRLLRCIVGPSDSLLADTTIAGD